MKRIQMDEVTQEVTKMIHTKREDILYCVTDDIYIFNGTSGKINPSVINKYKTFEFGQSGGTLVFAPGNIGIGMLQKDDGETAQQLMQGLLNFLIVYGITAQWLGNDIVVEGQYKVISHAQLPLSNGYMFTTIQINLYTTKELVEEVCVKPILKIPRPLSDYGIDTKLMELWLIQCVHALENNKEH